MKSKVKQKILISIFFISPLIISIFYWFTEPTPFKINSDELIMSLSHRISSILAISSFIWICFNIIITSKLKIIEKNFDLDKLVGFHKKMAGVSLILIFLHYPFLRLARNEWERVQRIQISTGSITMLTFLALMALAFIYMTNHLVKYKKIVKFRSNLFKKKFKYKFNKIIHNLSILGVSIASIHALLSFTSASSIFWRGVYIIFFAITLISWISHKVFRRFRSNPDPYIYRKASWDTVDSEIVLEKDNNFALNVLERNPTLYPCFQCGVCADYCPVANVTEGKYNPRKLILKVLLGFEEKIFGQENVFTIWGCTVCDTCNEVCPQKVIPLDIFSTLKNMSSERGEAPAHYYTQSTMVLKYGKAIPMQPAIERRREELNLPSILTPDINELKKLLNSTNLKDKLISSSKD